MFQSSPAINCGCHVSRIRYGTKFIGFNPHPRSTAGVTTSNLYLRQWIVFQSSPAINCGCHATTKPPLSRHRCFNPHPRSTAGVTIHRRYRQHNHLCFNPHPRSTAGVTSGWVGATAQCHFVSILTRDQLRVSLILISFTCVSSIVSILTRDQLRVSLPLSREAFELGGFNPHPRSTAGVTPKTVDAAEFEGLFQSSPAINCGCHNAIGSNLGTFIGFNPHPRSTAGVTCAMIMQTRSGKFQSSPAINCGCHPMRRLR